MIGRVSSAALRLPRNGSAMSAMPSSPSRTERPPTRSACVAADHPARASSGARNTTLAARGFGEQRNRSGGLRARLDPSDSRGPARRDLSADRWTPAAPVPIIRRPCRLKRAASSPRRDRHSNATIEARGRRLVRGTPFIGGPIPRAHQRTICATKASAPVRLTSIAARSTAAKGPPCRQARRARKSLH